MNLIVFRYVFFHVLGLLLIIYYGKKYQDEEQPLWRLSLVPICFYAIEKGLRWGRECDWWAYRDGYLDICKGEITNWEPLFYYVCKIFSVLGFDYPFVILLFTLLFICSVYCLLYYHKYVFALALPIFIIWLSPLAINSIRWIVAMSFAFIGIFNLLKSNIYISLLFLSFALFSHLFCGLLFIPVYMLFFYNRIILQAKYVIIISIGLVLLSDFSIVKEFTYLLDLFADSDRYGGYVHNADMWFTVDSNEQFQRKSSLLYLFVMIPFYIVLWQSEKISEECEKFHFLYNVMVINILLRSISGGSEIIQRMATLYDFAFLILCSYVLYWAWIYRESLLNKIVVVIMCSTFIYKTYIYIKPYKSDGLMQYYWDNNRIDATKAYNLYEKEKE